MFISVTRLQLRSMLYLPAYGIEAARAKAQAEQTPGCIAAQVRKTDGLAFWTMTFWEDDASMKRFMRESPHRAVMPKLAEWCDEAAAIHWSQDSRELISWNAGRDRLRDSGRLAPVNHPSDIQKNGVVNVS